MSVRSLKTRLKSIETKVNFNLYDSFYESLTKDEEQALTDALVHMILADYDERVTVEHLMQALDIDEGKAVELWNARERAEATRPIDDDFDRMTDEELIEYIDRTREEIREMASHDLR